MFSFGLPFAFALYISLTIIYHEVFFLQLNFLTLCVILANALATIFAYYIGRGIDKCLERLQQLFS